MNFRATSETTRRVRFIGTMLVFASSVFTGFRGFASSVEDFGIEYEELKVALDSVVAERDQLMIDLSKAQSAVFSMQIRANAADGESEVFRQQTSQIRRKVSALGLDSASDKASGLEPRLLSAVSDLRVAVADEKVLAMTLVRLIESVSVYASATRSIDVSCRFELESEIRNADIVLNNSSLGSVKKQTESKSSLEGLVVSVTEDLSLVVINTGRRHGIKVGMPLTVLRCGKSVGTIRVVDVREKISGAVIQSLSSPSSRIAFGDIFRADTFQ